MQSPLLLVLHTLGRKDELTPCRGTDKSAWQKPPVRREGGRVGLPKKGKWPSRGTGTTVLTYPCPSQPCFGGSKERARVTRKAGENGQHPGETGGGSHWTRPSAPECGDTLKAPAGDQRLDKCGDRPGSSSTGSPPGRTPPHGDGSLYSQANVKVESVLQPQTRALPSVIVDTEKVLREADGPVELSALTLPLAGKVLAPGCVSKAGLVSW